MNQNRTVPNLDHRIDFFSGFVSDHKKKLFREIIDHRTRFFTVVLEDIYQPQNASAVLRSCEGFGIQEVHVIENKNLFAVSKGVTIGSEKWIDIFRYNNRGNNNTKSAYKSLRDRGYNLIITTPHEKTQPHYSKEKNSVIAESCTDSADSNAPIYEEHRKTPFISPISEESGQCSFRLQNFYPEQPCALIFGSERDGLSRYAMEQADGQISIPMYGLIESFNISVSVALCLYHLRRWMHQSQIPWQLNNLEKKRLYLEWLLRSVKRRKALEQKYEELSGMTKGFNRDDTRV